MKQFIGIDIGGTKTLIALFSKKGRILRRTRFLTSLNSKTFTNSLVSNLQPFQKYCIQGIAVAIPGIVKSEQNNYSFIFGNRDWPNLDLLTPIKNLFTCPIYFENDANLAALYETRRFSGKSIYLTFSTGIGGGITNNGHLLFESTTFEPGHKIYLFNNQKLEWEDIASTKALNCHYKTPITSLKGKSIMQEIAIRVSLGVQDIISEQSPKHLVIGGPLAKIYPRFRPYLSLPKSETKITRAKRPFDSTIYGCYELLKFKK